MILQALNDFYGRLRDDPDAHVSPFGFSRQKIAFCVTLNQDGTLHSIDDLRELRGKNLVPKSLIVPGGAKSTGSGINPGFLWDNTAYLLGFKPGEANGERTRETFEAFRKRHLILEAKIDDAELRAVCRFLEQWASERATAFSFLSELTGGFGVFRMRAAQHFVHESPTVHAWWLNQILQGDGEQVISQQCLVLGEELPIARLHEPKIKGVLGAQSSGAAIVSFNQDAFESYGREQSFNAPVSVKATFQYCTSLNVLLAAESKQRLQIGDATVVFWTDRPSPAERFMGWLFETTAAEDEALKLQLQSILQQIAEGRQYPEALGEQETSFYVLGLSPNAARLSVRFWHESTVGTLVEHLRDHFNDFRLVRSSERDPEFPAVWQILRETARESKDIPPLLSGALMRSILSGARYPDLLFSSLIRRIRADRGLRYMRVAAIKACLNRATRLKINPLDQELGMTLDVDRREPAYHLGRFFAVLEKSQEDALPGINDTIKDRYFGAASATPRSVFPILVRLNQHHLGKLEKRYRVPHEKRIQEICAKIDAFPPHLNLRDQGLFAIGYYHQRQNLFAKKSTPDATPEGAPVTTTEESP